MRRSPLSKHEFLQGFKAGLPALTGQLENSFAEGSRNQIVQGGGPDAGSFVIPWQGLAGQGDDTGTRLMRQILSTWGGLKDYNVGSTHIEGRGSMFSDIGKSMWFIGSGVPSIEGVRLAPGIFASTELQVSIATNGLYSAANTYDAGLPQPSAPDIGIIATPGVGFTGFIEGPISCKIARLRLTTGARSVASKTSAVVNPAKKTVRVTFPLPSQGQDNWAVFFTQSGFGGVGLHYRAAYNDALDVPESTVAAGIIDGIARSLEFDFKDGDLIPEVAYIDDYPPPAGTHAVRLANVMCVLGCYGDSTAAVTAIDTGTCGAISLPNFYESFKPRFLVYFPEQIVDVMARPTDEYAYVGHRNSVTALQYVGVQDGPAVAVSMVWPDIGIAKPHNWCQVHGLIYAFQAKGGPVRMLADGSPDYSFAAPVRRYMRDWTVEETIVGSHPDSLSVVYFNGREALSWSLQANRWSPPCFFEDLCIEDSPVASSSPSQSVSPSASPSLSHSSSPSSSHSASPSSTPSVTPSSSLSASPSTTPSPSSSTSASPSVTPSASPSVTPSSSPSSSPSGSAAPIPSANLALWLMADSEVYNDAGVTPATNGQTVQQWNDHSGNARHASQATGGNRATLITGALNGLPVMRFVNGKFYTLPGTICTAGGTIFFVGLYNDQDTFDNGNWITGDAGGVGGSFTYRCPYGWTTDNMVLGGSSSSGTIGNGVYFQSNAVDTNAGGTDTTHRISSAASGSGVSGATGFGMDRIGSQAGNAKYRGDMAEIIIYDAALSGPDIATVEAYLFAKWGV